MDLEKVKSSFKGNVVGRGVLWLASQGYGAGAALNKFLFDHGWRKSYSVNTRVVCIGNITSGGTGKTTAVLLAARTLAAAGIRVSIVSRGYKRSKEDKNPVVLFDDELENNWASAGDEPFMMSRALADVKVPIVVHENRYLAATEALKRFKSQVILLDDGFQHFRLKRDANIVLIDARNPFGGGHLQPYGELREPVTALKRANLILITHSNQVPARKLEDIRDQIRLINEDVEILDSMHKPQEYYDICNSSKVKLDAVKGDAGAFSAIGEPGNFEDTLKSLGLNLTKVWRYPDHRKYTDADLKTFVDLAGDTPLITTFKDFIKLPASWRDIFKKNVYVLSVNMEIKGKKEFDIFTEVLYPKFSKLKEKEKSKK
ncbi:tetraacyldisaccharide 4'-kinase [Elusimicrobium simillimum]|uniref:tetraacyldisaccharide 4'-kinase n=1 Tax=Elusimicrobium simillimum TaxID=3143438 RepID=UPI003C6F3A96